MKMEIRARLGAVAQKGFTSNTGEDVEYQEAFFQYQDEQGIYDVAKVNTKQDMIPHLGKEGVVKIDVQESGKLKLISFNVSSKRTSEDTDL